MARGKALGAFLGACVGSVLTEGAVEVLGAAEMLGTAERLGALDTKGPREGSPVGPLDVLPWVPHSAPPLAGRSQTEPSRCWEQQ